MESFNLSIVDISQVCNQRWKYLEHNEILRCVIILLEGQLKYATMLDYETEGTVRVISLIDNLVKGEKVLRSFVFQRALKS